MTDDKDKQPPEEQDQKPEPQTPANDAPRADDAPEREVSLLDLLDDPDGGVQTTPPAQETEGKEADDTAVPPDEAPTATNLPPASAAPTPPRRRPAHRCR